MKNFVEIRVWGKRLGFLRRFLPYERGVPDRDMLNDVINALNPGLFESCFNTWVEAFRDQEPAILAIDGKT